VSLCFSGLSTGVWGLSASDVYVVGCAGACDGLIGQNATICHYDGAQWSAAWSDNAVNIEYPGFIWGTSDTDIYVAGSAHYDGSMWSQVLTGVEGGILAIRGAGPGDVFAVGDGGRILHYAGPPAER